MVAVRKLSLVIGLMVLTKLVTSICTWNLV